MAPSATSSASAADKDDRVVLAASQKLSSAPSASLNGKHIFQIEHVALTQAEIIADADRGVKVHRQLELSRLNDHGAENIVLEEAILVGSWDATFFVFRVDRSSFFTGRIAEI